MADFIRAAVMFPFAHSCDDFPPDAEMLMEAALGVAKTMRSQFGQGFQAGQACDLTYRCVFASFLQLPQILCAACRPPSPIGSRMLTLKGFHRAPGDAIDFAYGVTDVRWSYSAELRDTGTVSHPFRSCLALSRSVRRSAVSSDFRS